jgi:uncharacterized RDD family membrane protein YckC
VVTKQLSEYVQQSLSAGFSGDEIKKHLLGYGWDEEDINKTLHQYTIVEDSVVGQQPRYLEPGDPVHVEYATFVRRVAAFMIDFLILLPLNIFVVAIILSTGRDGAPIVIPIQVVVNWFYFALQESMSVQASFGKKFLGLYVARSSGEKITFWRASSRFFATFLSILPLGVGFIWIITNRTRQSWHDLLTDTVVATRESAVNSEKVNFYTRVGLASFFVFIALPLILILLAIIYQLVKPPATPQNSSPTVESSVDAQSRDTTRKSDITAYANALTKYFQSHHFYPKSATGGDLTASSNENGIFSSSGVLKDFSPTRLESGGPRNGELACQPNSFSPKVLCSYHYLTNSLATTYILWTLLELPGSGGGVYYISSTGSKGLLGVEPTNAP